MAIIKKHELKQLIESQIDDKLTELKKELMRLNTQRAMGTAIENPGKIKEIKRSIARLHTIKNLKLKQNATLAGGKEKV